MIDFIEPDEVAKGYVLSVVPGINYRIPDEFKDMVKNFNIYPTVFSLWELSEREKTDPHIFENRPFDFFISKGVIEQIKSLVGDLSVIKSQYGYDLGVATAPKNKLMFLQLTGYEFSGVKFIKFPNDDYMDRERGDTYHRFPVRCFTTFEYRPKTWVSRFYAIIDHINPMDSLVNRRILANTYRIHKVNLELSRELLNLIDTLKVAVPRIDKVTTHLYNSVSERIKDLESQDEQYLGKTAYEWAKKQEDLFEKLKAYTHSDTDLKDYTQEEREKIMLEVVELLAYKQIPTLVSDDLVMELDSEPVKVE